MKEQKLKVCAWEGCQEHTKTERHRFCTDHTIAHNRQKNLENMKSKRKWKSGFIYDMF